MPSISLKDMVGKGYKEFWNSKARYRVVKGSRGSKKSKTIALNMIYRLFKYPESNILCIRRYANTLRDSVYSDLKWAIMRLKLNEYFDTTLSPMTIVRRATGQKIIFRGLDDGQKITSISVDKGYLTFVWIEEAFELTSEDDFNKLDMSIRGEVPDGYFKQITLSLNPWSANHWIKRRFFDVASEDIFAITTTWKCNEWLDESDRKIFENMKANNPRRYRIEGDGEWGISEGLIYPNHELAGFDVQQLREKKDIKSGFGLDFGFTDPAAFVCFFVDKQEGKIYVFDEMYKKGATNKQLAESIILKGYASERVVCDSAEPKSIKELSDLGLRTVGSRKGRDSVNHGVQQIQNYKIIVHPKCTEFYKEISNYTWSRDRLGNLTDKPDHEFSHGMDALRYAFSMLMLPDLFSFD